MRQNYVVKLVKKELKRWTGSKERREVRVKINSLTWLMSGLLAGSQATASAADLAAFSLEELLQVRIVGASKYGQKQREVAASASVISRQEIKAFGWRTLAEALSSLPGVYSTYDRQYSYLGTRGFGVPGDFNTRVLLTINGNRVNDVVYDYAFSGRAFPLDMDLIERIEYIPGPGGAVYGQNALFGVINVVTRSGVDVGGAELALGYQSPQAAREGRATWGRKLDNGIDVMLSASGFNARGEDLFFTFGSSPISGVAAGLDGERDQTYAIHLAGHAWKFDLNYGDERKYDPTGSYFGDPLVPGQYQEDRVLLTQLQYQDDFAENTLRFTGRLFLGRERYRGIFNYEGDRSLSTASSDWWGGELRLLSTRWENHKLMLGLEYQNNGRRDQTEEDLLDPSNNIVIPGTGWRQGVYVQDEWAISKSLSATVGLRSDRSSASDQTLSPRAALIWQATNDATIKALYGRAHRGPNAFERDFTDQVTHEANPALRSEMVDTLELVMDQRLGKSLLLRGSLFQWNMKNLIALGGNVDGSLNQYQNGEDVTAKGLELSADKTWGNGARLRGSLTHQDARFASGLKLANSPRFMGKVNFSSPLPLPGMSMGFEARYDARRETITPGVYTGGYLVSNLYLTASKWGKGLDVSVGIHNLFDRQYEYPAAGSNWQNSLQQDGRQVRVKVIYQY